MSNYASLKATINANIKTNGNQEITGAVLNSVLNSMVTSLGNNYQFAGVAKPNTNPGTPDQNVFYIAAAPGTYTNFGSVVLVDGEVAILTYNGTWTKRSLDIPSQDITDEILAEIGSFPFPYDSTYITSQGTPGSTAQGYNCSNLIKVNPGDTWVFTGYFSAASLYLVWGYPSRSYDNGQGILPGGVNYVNHEFVIPTGVNYIMAWGGISNLSLYKKGNLQETDSRVSVLEQEMDQVKEQIGKNYFDDSVVGYIGADGHLIPGEVGIATPMVAVNEGDVIHYKGGWLNNAQIGLVWGYSAADESNPVNLLTAVSNIETDITIPSGVSYVRAWSTEARSPVLSKNGTILSSIAYLETKAEELDELRYDTTGLKDEYDASILTSTNYYSMSDGSLQGQSANYRTLEFEIPSWATRIIASFPGSNASFGILLYNSNGGFIRSYAAATSMEIDLSGLGAAKAIIQNYHDWSATTFSFVSKDHIADLEEDVEDLKGMVSADYVTIVATRNAANYNSIREIVAGITDATPSKKYIILVPVGRWFECDLQGKPNVIIVGEDRERTILYCDGTSSKVTPSDYSYGASTSGVALSSLPQSQKHCVFALRDIAMKNLTIEVNDAKYCVHLDATGWVSAQFDNCHFIANANVNYPVGIGIRGGQEIRFSGCILERISTGQNGFFAHNWNNQSSPSSITFEDCYFRKCGFATIDELGSEQEDDWKLLNCYSDRGGNISWMVDVDSQGKTYWVNPATGERESDPTLVPYCIKMNCLGSNVGNLLKQTFNNTSVVARPDCAKYLISDYLTSLVGASYLAGKAIRGYKTGLSIVEGNSYPLLGVIDSVVDGVAYMAKDNVFVLYDNIHGSSMNIGSLVYVGSDGYLTTTQTGDAVGVISSDAYGVARVVHLF